MLRPKIILSLLIVSFNLLNACAQKDASEAGADTPTEETKAPTEKADVHRYGGWYCPDNLGGFPPVDVASLDAVPVVHERSAILCFFLSRHSIFYYRHGIQ